MTLLSLRAAVVVALAASAVVATPTSAGAVAPTCSDMAVGVPHNTSLPVFIECAGGTGTGSPDILVTSNPGKGTLSVPAGERSTDQWITYTPAPGQSGTDTFTYRGVSAGSGAGGSDEISAQRTVTVHIAPGTAPTCLADSQTVVNDADSLPATLRLACDSGGDPITSYAVVQGPEHGSLGLAGIASGVVRYTPEAGHVGPDSFTFRATSTCGAASCQSVAVTFDLTVVQPLTGPAGPVGPAGPGGPTGPAGPAGVDGTVLTVDRLVLVTPSPRLRVSSGRRVRVAYGLSTAADVTMVVLRGSKRLARVTRTAAAGRGTITWNGRASGRPLPRGRYVLVLTAVAGGQRDADRIRLVLD